MKKGARGGFTLVEVIVSIAVLAVISGFILQFFITSDRLNGRSSAVDMASVLAASVIEEYKGQAQPGLLAQPGRVLDGAQVTATADGTEAFLVYDGAWNRVAASDPSAVYTLSVQAVRQGTEAQPMSLCTDGSGGQLLRGLYTITARVSTRDVADGTGSLADPLLVELTGARYFTWMEGGAQ